MDWIDDYCSCSIFTQHQQRRQEWMLKSMVEWMEERREERRGEKRGVQRVYSPRFAAAVWSSLINSHHLSSPWILHRTNCLQNIHSTPRFEPASSPEPAHDGPRDDTSVGSFFCSLLESRVEQIHIYPILIRISFGTTVAPDVSSHHPFLSFHDSDSSSLTLMSGIVSHHFECLSPKFRRNFWGKRSWCINRWWSAWKHFSSADHIFSKSDLSSLMITRVSVSRELTWSNEQRMSPSKTAATVQNVTCALFLNKKYPLRPDSSSLALGSLDVRTQF